MNPAYAPYLNSDRAQARLANALRAAAGRFSATPTATPTPPTRSTWRCGTATPSTPTTPT